MASQSIAGPSTGSSKSHPEEQSPLLSSTQTRELFEKLKKEWQGSKRRGEFKKELEKQITAGNFVLQKAIIFGLGNFTGGGMDVSEEWLEKWKDHLKVIGDQRMKTWKQDRTKRLRQLVFFLDVQEIVTSHSKSKTKLQVFAQDPEFGTGDIKFLTKVGITVVGEKKGKEDEGDNMVGPDTITYSAFLTWRETLGLIARCSQHGPAIHLGSDLSGMMDKIGGDAAKTWKEYKAAHKINDDLQDPNGDRTAYMHIRTGSGGFCKKCFDEGRK
ncbi:hypothetical protein LTR37_020393 [Vermiconidia calcicola]|uniref:Uncharacterized protein n=1 Tax=Vermiconidia calcicola TaxID=1690605 RepID=A0ACC3MBM0_9PEZI|nr:hypothetical protein LTR37_020393 [Vermiconidia calcicola]